MVYISNIFTFIILLFVDNETANTRSYTKNEVEILHLNLPKKISIISFEICRSERFMKKNSETGKDIRNIKSNNRLLHDI